jgi:single-stranded DNA-binding protein
LNDKYVPYDRNDAVSERPVIRDAPSSAPPADHHRWVPRWSRADVQLIGRVGGDPDIRFAVESADGAWAHFSVATEVPHDNHDAPDWHTVISSDRLAQLVSRYVGKGRLVHVVGWLTYRTVDRRSGEHRVAEIRASQVLLLDRPVSRAAS